MRCVPIADIDCCYEHGSQVTKEHGIVDIGIQVFVEDIKEFTVNQKGGAKPKSQPGCRCCGDLGHVAKSCVKNKENVVSEVRSVFCGERCSEVSSGPQGNECIYSESPNVLGEREVSIQNQESGGKIKPRSKCRFCGKAGHMARACEVKSVVKPKT